MKVKRLRSGRAEGEITNKLESLNLQDSEENQPDRPAKSNPRWKSQRVISGVGSLMQQLTESAGQDPAEEAGDQDKGCDDGHDKENKDDERKENDGDQSNNDGNEGGEGEGGLGDDRDTYGSDKRDEDQGEGSDDEPPEEIKACI